MAIRDISDEESRRIGFLIGDPFVAFGHPLTCNGGNPYRHTHHDHEVRMKIDGRTLICPECGRAQDVGWPPGAWAGNSHGPA